jgi:hypothetical protein
MLEPVPQQGAKPNTHKALGVKRKYFPRERLSTAFSCRISEQCSCGGGELSSAIRLGYQRRTQYTHDQRPRRTAPNTHADSGGSASQGRAAVPGNLPWPVPILIRSQQRRHSKATGSLLERSVPLGTAGGWGGSSGRSLLWITGRGLAGVGRTWDGHWPERRFSRGQLTLIPFFPPTHRRTATCLYDHRGRTRRTRPASHQSVWMPGRSRTPAAESMLPWCLRSSCGLARSGSRSAPGSPAAPWLSVSGIGRY